MDFSDAAEIYGFVKYAIIPEQADAKQEVLGLAKNGPKNGPFLVQTQAFLPKSPKDWKNPHFGQNHRDCAIFTKNDQKNTIHSTMGLKNPYYPLQGRPPARSPGFCPLLIKSPEMLQVRPQKREKIKNLFYFLLFFGDLLVTFSAKTPKIQDFLYICKKSWIFGGFWW